MKFSSCRLVVLALSLCAALPVSQAMEPPRPGEIEQLKADGLFAQRLAFAEQIGNHRFSPYLVQRFAHRMDPETYLAPPPDWVGMPTTGDVRILVILIAFADYPNTNSLAAVDNDLFGAGTPSAFPLDSLANYYDRASYGLLDMSHGNTLGWYTTAYNRSTIAMTTAGREALIMEALNYFDGQGHDFTQYDNDGDGDIDYFAVIWTGPDNGWGNFWWGYKTGWWWNPGFTLDGKYLADYSWQWESNPVEGDFDPLVIIHETGHGLGLPDYYDYDPDVGPDGGVGGLDMMDANMLDHNGFSKWMLEWLTPQVMANGNSVLSLPASGTGPHAVVIMPDMHEDKIFSEFFLVQNREKVGNDNFWWPSNSEGLVVWHVDATLSGGGFAYDNSWADHKLLRLMEADGLEEIETSSAWADAGDFFTNGDTFDNASSPNSATYAGGDSTVSVSGFGTAGASMEAAFSVVGSDAVLLHNFELGNTSGWAIAVP